MNRLTTSVAIACGAALFATPAHSETVDQLKRELAAKKAYISKLERQQPRSGSIRWLSSSVPLISRQHHATLQAYNSIPQMSSDLGWAARSPSVRPPQ